MCLRFVNSCSILSSDLPLVSGIALRRIKKYKKFMPAKSKKFPVGLNNPS
jgi:hypothetical protein